MVKKGREIYYVLSRGESFAEVPDVRSKTVRRQAELENRQLQFGNVDNVFPSYCTKRQRYWAKIPGKGRQFLLEQGSTLIVSLGQEPETAVVPRLIGLPSLDKARALGRKPFWNWARFHRFRGSFPMGQSFPKTRREGTEVPIRTRVAVAISLGSQEPVHSHTVKIKVPNKANPVNVRVVVMDLDGELVRHDRNESPGDNINVSFQYKGNVAIMKIYLDGRALPVKK